MDSAIQEECASKGTPESIVPTLPVGLREAKATNCGHCGILGGRRQMPGWIFGQKTAAETKELNGKNTGVMMLGLAIEGAD